MVNASSDSVSANQLRSRTTYINTMSTDEMLETQNPDPFFCVVKFAEKHKFHQLPEREQRKQRKVSQDLTIHSNNKSDMMLMMICENQSYKKTVFRCAEIHNCIVKLRLGRERVPHNHSGRDQRSDRIRQEIQRNRHHRGFTQSFKKKKEH
jgi:hypothetical protein